jgi:hypothetical protein
MFDSRLFLRQTAETASFALREYFRPVVAVVRFVKASLAPPNRADPAHDDGLQRKPEQTEAESASDVSQPKT